MQLGEIKLKLPLIGRHNAANLLAAVAAAGALGLTGEEVKGLSDFPRSLRPLGASKGRQVLRACDYYNANPSSMKAGLESLAKLGSPRWACLGDMLELGRARTTTTAAWLTQSWSWGSKTSCSMANA